MKTFKDYGFLEVPINVSVGYMAFEKCKPHCGKLNYVITRLTAAYHKRSFLMKKTILAALTVLLVMLAVTCDSSTPGFSGVEKEPPRYTEDGRLLVSLSIGTGNASRAMTGALAKANADYYEVAFQDLSNTSKTYRASWDYTKTGRIAVPAGDYDDASKAILFAGRKSDRTLLAVGVITAVDGTAGTEITSITTSVTFTLSALTNDVKNDPVNSTFQITGPVGYETSDIASVADFPLAKIDNINYPLFRIPDNIAAINADYDVNFPTISTIDTKDGIIVQSLGTIYSMGFVYENKLGEKTPSLVVEGTYLTPAANTAVTGTFALEIDTTGTLVPTGISRLSIEVPVCAINTANDAPDIWYIRGGMYQADLDAGNSTNSLGGAVLLAVGLDVGYVVDIIIN
jgi:hypothetical protein